MNKRKKIESHYEPRIQPDRDSYDILDWADPESQIARFAVLAEAVDLRGRSLLDVGCGLGDLYLFLRERGIRAEYTGVDIVKPMVEEARRRNPGARFVWADVFAEPPRDPPPAGAHPADDGKAFAGRSFDVVFCSGVFNLDLENNHLFLPQALGRLFALARTHVVFNLLHVRTPNRYAHCVYYDPADVLAVLHDFPCRARVVDNYLHNDFTVVCDL